MSVRGIKRLQFQLHMHVVDLLLLTLGYWASYNVPFYPVIFNMSGYRDMVNVFGTLLSHSLAPRAKIFRRDQGKVVDMKSMQAIMRYNGMYLGHVCCCMLICYSLGYIIISLKLLLQLKVLHIISHIEHKQMLEQAYRLSHLSVSLSSE